MKNMAIFAACLLTTLFILNHLIQPAYAQIDPYPLPEFTQTSKQAWINSPPLSIEDLTGKVTLIDVWTFDCWNCYRSFPWLNSLEARFDPSVFAVIGVHTPEYDHEKVRSAVVNKANEFKLHHPIMMDNNFSYWKALNNQYWPAYYLVDKKGSIRYRFIGETHKNSRKAKSITQAIERLLAE
jgi:thiol-disulfide isomerase/thioredoxin